MLLANNFNQFASQSAVSAGDLAALDAFAAANGISLASVPEPASMGLVLLAGVGALSRRGRRRKFSRSQRLYVRGELIARQEVRIVASPHPGSLQSSLLVRPPMWRAMRKSFSCRR